MLRPSRFSCLGIVNELNVMPGVTVQGEFGAECFLHMLRKDARIQPALDIKVAEAAAVKCPRQHGRDAWNGAQIRDHSIIARLARSMDLNRDERTQVQFRNPTGEKLPLPSHRKLRKWVGKFV